MTIGQFKELIEFLKLGTMIVIATKTVDNGSVEIKIVKEIEKDVFHYITITVPITKE